MSDDERMLNIDLLRVLLELTVRRSKLGSQTRVENDQITVTILQSE